MGQSHSAENRTETRGTQGEELGLGACWLGKKRPEPSFLTAWVTNCGTAKRNLGAARDNALLFTPDQAILSCILEVVTSTPQSSEMRADTAALDMTVGTAGPRDTVLRVARRNR